MPKVISVRLGEANKLYYFDPAGFDDLQAGDRVIVDTARGRELGEVAGLPHEVPDNQIVGKLKPVLRRAEPWDLIQAENFKAKEKEALATCKSMVARAGLPMKLVRAEYSFDGTRLTFYFTSEKRVDFRSLVRDLAKTFHTRIELRQIGVRDEAKLIGGLGRCGRPLCCGTWLREFIPVSIKMAKQQDLPLNPTEISGVCSRLLCCLAYENDFYCEVKGRLPKVGRIVMTKEGRGRVLSHDPFKETVRVELENEVIIEVPAEELLDHGERPQPAPMPQPPAAERPAGEGSGRRKRKKKKNAAASEKPPAK
jgi:cell fate regulator YaaT (PSP1 superfamily)